MAYTRGARIQVIGNTKPRYMMIPGTQKPVIYIDKTREPTRSSLFLAGVEPTQEFYDVSVVNQKYQ